MNKYILAFIFSLGLCYLQAQTNSDCLIKKIIIYEANFKHIKQAEIDTTRKTTFHINYLNQKISQIQIERNFSSHEKKNQTVNLLKEGNKTFLLNAKDTLFIFEYDKLGKPQKVLSFLYRSKQESIFEYDNQNRIAKEIRKGGITDDLTIRFFYENEKEIKKIIKGESEFGEFSKAIKYVSVIDDKKNPFYRQYELAYLVSEDLSAHFPNNIILDYNLSEFIGISKNIKNYIFNSYGFPIAVLEYSYDFSSNSQHFARKILFEYDCGK